MAKRTYRLRERAAQQEATRQRIIEATAELHATVGPAATTVSAVAERAGMQRLTVYRHFPDEAELFAACAGYNQARYPAPDPALWGGIADPVEYAETALAALYGHYAAGAQGLALVLRDAERLPALHEVLEPWRGYLRHVAGEIAGRWRPAPGAERRFHAAVGHALDFWTWRSLAGQGLDPGEAARLMVRLIAAAAEDENPEATPPAR